MTSGRRGSLPGRPQKIDESDDQCLELCMQNKILKQTSLSLQTVLSCKRRAGDAAILVKPTGCGVRLRLGSSFHYSVTLGGLLQLSLSVLSLAAWGLEYVEGLLSRLSSR